MRDNIILKSIVVVLSVIITSFYFFTFKFTYFAGANTKTVLAGVALLLLLIELAKSRRVNLSKEIVIFTIYAMCMSLICMAAVVYNGTQDYTYVTYFVSMWVWLAAAYSVLLFLHRLNGRISFDMLANYLIIVCVAQCVLALLISRVPSVEVFASKINPGLDQLKRMADGRLFGLGCAFDVAGIRFSCVLVLIVRMICSQYRKIELNKSRVVLYWLSFLFIVVVGNMIARTTTVGALIALAYLFFASSSICRETFFKIWRSFIIVILLCAPIAVYLYNTDMAFREDVRFGFEGFFSLAETGRWEVSSNDILATMYRFPETLKTWLIGDGYIESANNDPYYLGEYYLGYYKGTDVGYLRFIYYAGLPFLIAFIAFLSYVTRVCAKKYSRDRLMFIFILIVQIAVWFKVATDIFMFFALFLAWKNLGYEEVQPEEHSNDICYES